MSARSVAGRYVVAPTREVVRRLRGFPNRNKAPYNPDARRGEIADVFDRIRKIEGFFTFDDCSTFTSILRMQTYAGTTGDILEIGPYHGRSTAVLAGCLADGERLVAIDAFELDTDFPYRDPASPDLLRRHLLAVNPNLDLDRVEIIKAYSTDVTFPEERRFRFVHVDGGHSAEVALSDLRLAHRHLAPGGIIVVDDYEHAFWPGVTEGVRQFLAEATDVVPLLDANRHAESGRKLYLRWRSTSLPEGIRRETVA